ncbi:hypothetical protein ACXVUM_12340 [Williamsia sp. SKLECPSW1]
MTDQRAAPRRGRPLSVAVGVIVVLLVAIAVVAVVGARGPVRTSADVAVGGCVVVADRGNGAFAVDAVGCAGDGVAFYVSDRPRGDAPCPAGTGAASVATDVRVDLGDGGTVCLVPNLRQGRCYLLPVADDGSGIRRAARYERKGCSTVAGASDSPIYAVTRRSDGVSGIDCPAGQLSWGTADPRPIALCLTPTTSP